MQAYAQNVVVANRNVWPKFESDREGVSQPLWVGNELLLARLTKLDEELVVQGCWLDWPGMKAMLTAEVADLLPAIDLIPVVELGMAQPSRMLAAIPAQLVVPPSPVEPPGWTAIRGSLLLAWICCGLAIAAVGILSHGVLALSERRDAFVSSVTHELRTPLTTFRMYSEMLAEDMVVEPEQRAHYLRTLRNEAERLFHLVENVLSYARLERASEPPRREWMEVDTLLARITDRLDERARLAQMELEVETSDATRALSLRTDAGAIEQILFNLVDNACKYAGSATDRRIQLQVVRTQRELSFRVRDYGKGVSAAEAGRLFRPFSKSAAEVASTAPGVGPGIGSLPSFSEGSRWTPTLGVAGGSGNCLPSVAASIERVTTMTPEGSECGVVAVVTSGSRLLMIRRSRSVIAPLKYCFPGGGIDAGESESDALCRELREELAARVVPRYCLWRSVTPWNVSLAWWFAWLANPNALQANPGEVDAWGWYEIESLIEMPDLLESNREFLAAWQRGEFVLPLE